MVTDQGGYTEAVTNRDELLLTPAKLVESGRQRTLKLAASAKWWGPLPPTTSVCKNGCAELRRSWMCSKVLSVTSAGTNRSA